MVTSSLSFVCRLSIIYLSLLLTSSTLSAQNCGPWLDVKSWQGTYTITGRGSGPDTSGFYNWTINHQYTATTNFKNGPSECSQILIWSGTPSSASGSGNDSGTAIGTVCDYGVTASGSVVPPFPTMGLLIDPVQNVYYLHDSASIPALWVRNRGCPPKPEPVNLALALGPASSPAIPLPSKVDVLEKSTFPFTAPTLAPEGVPTAWTLSFKLTPSRAWVKVWMNGGSAGQPTVAKEVR